jgi:hypothetical protein
MGTLIKLVVFAFSVVFVYAFLRPLAVSTYCHWRVGTGNGSRDVSFDQAINPQSAKSVQDSQVQSCIGQTLPRYTIKPVEDLFKTLSSPNSIPGVTSPH